MTKINTEFECVCKKCGVSSILDKSEIEKREFECPECNNINHFTEDDLNTIKDKTDSEKPTVKTSSNKIYIIGIIIIAIAAAGYFAWISDTVTFLNPKGKALSHVDKGNKLFTSQQNSQQPDPKVMQEALDEFKKAGELDKDNFDAILNKGVIMAGMGNFTESLIELDKAIQMKPEISDAYLYRALCRLQLGELDKSMPDFNKCIEIDPQNLNAVFYRANTKFELKNYASAMEDMEKIIVANPQFPNGYAFRGLCKVNLGKDKDGCDDFKKAKELGFELADSLITKYCK